MSVLVACILVAVLAFLVGMFCTIRLIPAILSKLTPVELHQMAAKVEQRRHRMAMKMERRRRP